MRPAIEFPLKAPRRLTIESGTLINRGLRDIAPKYLDTAKLAASLLRQICGNHLDSLTAANIFMPFGGPEAERLSSVFQDAATLSISAPLLGTMIDRLYSLTGRTALAVVSPAEAPSPENIGQFARALVAHDRYLEVTLARDLTSRARDIDFLASKDNRFDREIIVVEERGGKFGQLTLEEPTVRLHLKKWQGIINSSSGRDSRGDPKAPLDTASGFGAGAAILSDASTSASRTSRSIFFAATSAKLTDSLSVELVAQWKHATHIWLKDLGLPPDTLKRVYISAPYFAISAFIGQAFASSDPSNPLIMYPDQVYGWQPLLSLLAMMRQPSLPALFVHGGSGPTIQLAAVWAAP
jgi:hypothetical protein